METDPCEICTTTTAQSLASNFDGVHQICPRCGEFKLSGTAGTVLRRGVGRENRAKLSGWIREQNAADAVPMVTTDTISEVLAQPLPSTSERALRILKEAERGQESLGEPFSIAEPRFQAASYSSDSQEVSVLLRVLSDLGLVEEKGNGTECEISAAGYTKLDEVRGLSGSSDSGDVELPGHLPERIGDWVVESALNGGAQAYVYLVRKQGREGSFVLKQLKPWGPSSKQSSQREQRARFITEVSTLETLRLAGCPRIVEVVDSMLDLESKDPLWYVMPFYAGGSLRKSAGDGEPADFAEDFQGNIDRVLSIGADLAETVAAMHGGSPQFVHRDIHTQNVFFEAQGGRPILGDFGLAAKGKSTTGKGTALEEGFGPWRWRPPEIRPGSDRKRETGSDVYMIAGVMYEALTGGLYLEETQDIDNNFIHEKGRYRLSNFVDDPRLPYLEALFRRCFIRDPDERFTATELYKACKAVAQWRPTDLPPDFGSRQTRMSEAARRAMAVSPVAWNMKQREELNEIVDTVRHEIVSLREDVGSSRNAGEVSTQLRMNSYPGPVKIGYQDLSGSTVKESAAACLLVVVEFHPEPKIEFSSAVFLWRDRDSEYVGVAGKGLDAETISTSFHGDPNHSTLIRQIVVREVDRLQDAALLAIERFVEDAAK